MPRDASLSPPASARIPFYRNLKRLEILLQALFGLSLAVLFFYLLRNMFIGLARQNLSLDFQFMTEAAGFEISEGPTFSPADSYWKAFQVGLLNTLRVSGLGILFSTVLGIFIGIGRLSRNLLLRGLSSIYVEVIRNIPLLVQLFVCYQVFLLKLPGIRQAVRLPGAIFLSNRGIFFPWWTGGGTDEIWLSALSLGLLTGLGTLALMRRWEVHSGLPKPKFLLALLVCLGVVLLSLKLLPEIPLQLSRPELKRFNFEGGLRLSPEFMGLLLGLIIYTSAFIAEIVRAGILAVPKGQSEAAQALGLQRLQAFRWVVFPQALRVIFPPLANQYLNLCKNSSLGLVVGFAELFQVSQTISNQSGNAIPVILLIMGTYLALSLLISASINGFNARLKGK